MPISQSQAWAEAAASRPDLALLATLELHHSQFVENGVVTPVRAVRNTVNLDLRLEVGAPVSPGELVTFTAIPFEIEAPRIGPIGAECPIRIENVAREVGKYLEAAVRFNEPVRCIFRGYVEDDPDIVAHGPYRLFLASAKRRGGVIEGTLTNGQPRNKRVMNEVYDLVRFPNLTQIT